MKRYSFNGKTYGGNRRPGLGRMAFDIIEDWVGKNLPTSLGELTVAFPQNLNGSSANSQYQLVVSKQVAEQIFADDPSQHRHVRDEGELLTVRLGDGSEYAVSNQWRSDELVDARGHIAVFVEHARTKGFNIQEITDEKCHNSEQEDAGLQVVKEKLSLPRGYHINDSQNYLVRYILSKLGGAPITEDAWQEMQEYFGGKCAYCGKEAKLEIDHAVPINKEFMGEDRLGNLVPSCRNCNSKKHTKDYREFLADNADARLRIEEYMRRCNYSPIKDREDAEKIREVLKIAYGEIKPLADRYIRILNSLLG